MSENSYENKYNKLMSHLDSMHKRNIQKTRAALRSFLIIPTVFLILVFLTNSSKTVFLILWIASMFAIAAVLIVTEYQDYTVRRIVQSVLEDDAASEQAAEAPADAAETPDSEAAEPDTAENTVTDEVGTVL